MNLLDLIRFGMHGATKDVVLISGAGLLLGLLAMIVPLATGEIVSSILPSAEVGLLVQMGVFLSAVAISGALVQVTRTAAVLRLETRTSSDVQAALWDRLLRLSPSFFREYSTGDLADRTNAVDRVRRALAGGTIAALMNGVFSIANATVMFAADVSLGLIATALVLSSIA
jgi:ABC-type bacteriocin/lantibiotic exporter with double-glycine peptidase domain